MDNTLTLAGILLVILLGLFLLIIRLSSAKREKVDEFGAGPLARRFVVLQGKLGRVEKRAKFLFGQLAVEMERYGRPEKLEAIWRSLNEFLDTIEEVLTEIGNTLDDMRMTLRSIENELKEYQQAVRVFQEKEPESIYLKQAQHALGVRETLKVQVSGFIKTVEIWRGRLREIVQDIRAGYNAFEKEKELLLAVHGSTQAIRQQVYQNAGLANVNFSDPFGGIRTNILNDVSAAEAMLERVMKPQAQTDEKPASIEDPILARARGLKDGTIAVTPAVA